MCAKLKLRISTAWANGRNSSPEAHVPANPIPAAAIRFRNSRLSMGLAGTGVYFPFLFASIAPLQAEQRNRGMSTGYRCSSLPKPQSMMSTTGRFSRMECFMHNPCRR